MAFEGPFEITCFKLPYFDTAIFGGGCHLGVAGVKSQRGDVGFVALHLEFGGSFGQEQILKIFLLDRPLASLLQIILQILNLLLQFINFLLQRQDRFVLDLQFGPVRINITQ